MFARTERLLLRPGFPEDAPALVAAIADDHVVRQLAKVPWPYRLSDAQAFLRVQHHPLLPSLLAFERTSEAPRLVGSCALNRRPSGSVELGYWVARSEWGRGIATEACTAMIAIAQALRLPALEASHFLDNPKSGRILEKLGFHPTGVIAPLFCKARGEDVPARFFRLGLQRACAPQVQDDEETLAA